MTEWGFPGGPVTKTSNAGSTGSVLAGKLRSYTPRGQKAKTQNGNTIVTNSIKTKNKIFFNDPDYQGTIVCCRPDALLISPS